MPKVTFKPANVSIDMQSDAKILLCARKAGVPLRYGCASCRCGTCAVKVSPDQALLAMKSEEKDLLAKMKLPTNGSVRLSCQAKVVSDVEVDVSFQDTYSPDDGDDLYSENDSNDESNS